MDPEREEFFIQMAADHPDMLCSEVPAELLEAASYAGDEPNQFLRSFFTTGYTQWLRLNVSPRLRLPKEQIDKAVMVLWVRACILNTSRISGRPDDNWPKPFFWDEELAD